MQARAINNFSRSDSNTQIGRSISMPSELTFFFLPIIFIEKRSRVVPAPIPDPSPGTGQRLPRAGHKVRAGGRRRGGQEQPYRQLHLQWVPRALPAHSAGHLLRYVQRPRRPRGWGWGCALRGCGWSRGTSAPNPPGRLAGAGPKVALLRLGGIKYALSFS